MTRLQLIHGGALPQLAHLRQRLAGWDGIPLVNQRLRGLAPRLLALRCAASSELERRLQVVRADPELASCAFILILIALTFLV